MSLKTDMDLRWVGTAKVLNRRADATDVRLVLPPGEHAAASLPCVFVCPAGSNLLVGVPFGPGEQEDFYPFLKAGMAVCFYTLDGTVDLDAASEKQVLAAIPHYKDADAGICNLSDAIDTVLASSPAVDPSRLAACGHSSAGTIAVMAAAREPRIKAVAALAPAIDVPKRLSEVVRADASLARFIRSISPSEIGSLPCPVWIYHAEDDDNVPLRDTQKFAERHGGQVTLRVVGTGGHFGAYTYGLPEAVTFLATTLKATPAQ
jgi:dienelactone hydrolase